MTHQAGTTIVEVMVAIALTGIFLPVLATALVAAHAGKASSIQQIQAQSLLREGTDAVRNVREKGWTNVATDGTYHPVISGSTWALTSGSETINGLTRQVVISTPQRNSSGVIVAIGGTNDPSTKHVVVSVSWNTPTAGSLSTDAYLTRWQANTVWSQTTKADFDTALSQNNTEVTNTSGGEIQLDSDGNPNWATSRIAGSYNNAGTQDALDAYTSGDNAFISDGAVMSIYSKTNPTAPTLLSTFAAASTISQVYVRGNYAYLATASNTAELQIVDITNRSAPVLASNVNLAGTADGLAVSSYDTYAYVGRATSTTTGSYEFQILDVTNPAAPTVLGGVEYTGNVNNIKINGDTGDFAYIATSLTGQELTILDITNPSSPVGVGIYNAPGTSIANDLGIDPIHATTVYMARANNTTGAEVYSVDVSNPSSPTQVSSYEVGGAVNGISVVNDRVYLATSILTKQFIVLSIGAGGALSLLDTFSTGGNNFNDVKAVGNYAFCASASNTQELTVMGPTFSGNYALSGSSESATFDTGSTVGFNGLVFTVTKPANTNVRFQVATNSDRTTWNFVGPDGTAASYYSAVGGIPLSIVSNRYVRYVAYLTGNGTVTPVVNDVEVNYSP